MVQGITVLKELNTARRLSLPDVPGLVIRGRTRPHREVGMKEEMEEMALWLRERFKRGDFKDPLESVVSCVN